MSNRGALLAALAFVLLVSSSPLAAAGPVIKRGIDVFTTTGSGKTFFDFARNPIPAGFFCSKSAVFTGRVAFKGLPLETSGYLRGADTVIERLDDAVFNARGTAATRIRFRALSLVSISPVETACGAFHVYVSLAKSQRVTTMSIHRTQAGGGTFAAPLAVNARLTFIPAKPAKAEKGLKPVGPRKLELTTSFTFPARPLPWSLKGSQATKQIGSVVVDTNGDLVPDTRLRGTSNFWPGWSPEGVQQQTGASCEGQYLCQPETCHSNSGKDHCTGPVCAPHWEACP